MKSEFEYNKKDRLVVVHQTISEIAGSRQGDWLRDRSNPSEPQLKDGLFFMGK